MWTDVTQSRNEAIMRIDRLYDHARDMYKQLEEKFHYRLNRERQATELLSEYLATVGGSGSTLLVGLNTRTKAFLDSSSAG